MHRIKARAARGAAAPRIERDPALVESFLTDAAHVPGGSASGVAFPRTEADVAALVTRADRVLPVGAQSSLTGGATPRGDLVLSTRALASIAAPAGGTVRVGAGVPLSTLQHLLAAHGLYYPPAPTYDGALAGGTIATNAAGAATFKYGTTRSWVAAITVVLASGDVLDIERGATVASADGHFEIERTTGETLRVPVPAYVMPRVSKLSAGYFARPQMDLIDLFIGSEGTLGVIVEATLRVIARPRRLVALVTCTGDAQAVALASALRAAALAAWAGRDVLDVSAIEYIDARALRLLPDGAFADVGLARSRGEAALLLVQIEVDSDEEAVVERLVSVLEANGVTADPCVAAPDDERGAERLFRLREAVPASANALVAAARRNDPAVEKTAGDMIVPFERLADSLALYRRAFERRGLEYAIWGHVSDGNLHPNVLPRSFDDVRSGREAIIEIAQGVIAMGGAPLAEHGVGRSPTKQRLLRELYGDEGIAEMRAVKRALDPDWKLAPGVLFPEP